MITPYLYDDYLKPDDGTEVKPVLRRTPQPFIPSGPNDTIKDIDYVNEAMKELYKIKKEDL